MKKIFLFVVCLFLACSTALAEKKAEISFAGLEWGCSVTEALAQLEAYGYDTKQIKTEEILDYYLPTYNSKFTSEYVLIEAGMFLLEAGMFADDTPWETPWNIAGYNPLIVLMLFLPEVSGRTVSCTPDQSSLQSIRMRFYDIGKSGYLDLREKLSRIYGEYEIFLSEDYLAKQAVTWKDNEDHFIILLYLPDGTRVDESGNEQTVFVADLYYFHNVDLELLQDSISLCDPSLPDINDLTGLQ